MIRLMEPKYIMRRQNGFTLIELIVVVVLIGILAAVAIPLIGDVLRQARIGQVRGMMGAFQSAIQMQVANDIGNNSAFGGFPACTTTWGSLFTSGQNPRNILMGNPTQEICCSSTSSPLVNATFLSEVGQGTGGHCSNMAGAADWFYISGEVWPAFPDTTTYDVSDFII